MKAPAFWWRTRPGLAGNLLAPLGAVYGAITTVRMRRDGAAAGVPVLCVGNLVVGGAGKTPATIALARMIQADGHRPTILSRGYGRAAGAAEGLLVDPDRHDAAEAGDEPLLLARAAPTIVGADRLATARRAAAAGVTCLILDDGLQNPALRKTWTLAVADGGSGTGNGLCLPAGPLRAPIALQWPLVSLLCVIGAGEPGERVKRSAQRWGVPVTTARLVPDPATVARWRGRRLFAFAGIGRPEKFFATLRDATLTVTGTRRFPDHHAFTAGDLAGLRASAGDALLVTTVKDRVRLPTSFPAEALPVDLVFDEPDVIRASLALSLG